MHPSPTVRDLVQGPYQAELVDVTTDQTYVVIET